MRNYISILLILVTLNVYAQDFKSFNLAAISGLSFNQEKINLAADGFYQDRFWAVGGMVDLNYQLSNPVNEDGCVCKDEQKLNLNYRVYGEVYCNDAQVNKLVPYAFAGLEQFIQPYGGLGILWNIEKQNQLRFFCQTDLQYGVAFKRVFNFNESR